MNNYKNLTLSFFFKSFDEIVPYISGFILEKNKIRDVEIRSGVFTFSETLTDKDANLLRYFFIGKNEEDSKTIFFSNLKDGWYTGVLKFSRDAKCKCIKIVINDDEIYPFYSFHIINCGKTVRLIQLYKEGKWTFYQEGDPFEYENTSLYTNKIKKNRLNSSVILDYLAMENIDIEKVLSNSWGGIHFNQLSYDYVW